MSELVTVVVPIYNVEQYLERCLESIVNQTYTNLEIILVDDGSPDQCPGICDAWAEKDERISVIHKINQGLGKARNSGLQSAHGKYIFFFDSDDYIALNLIERCVATAEALDADTVIFGRSDVYPNGEICVKKLTVEKEVYEGNEITEALLPSLFSYSLGYGMSSWSKMFSLNIFSEHNLLFPSERVIVSEDSMFSLEYFTKASRVAVIPDNLYYYFKNDKSLTHTYREDRQRKNNDFLNKCVEKACELGLPATVSAHIKARYHGMTLGTLMQIERSDFDRKEKKAKLRKIYRDDVLRQTLTGDVIHLDEFFPRLFWMCLKFRCYLLCDLLLVFNKYR